MYLKKTDCKIGPLASLKVLKMCIKIIVYTMITIFTIFGQNTPEYYKSLSFNCDLYIFWEFGLKSHNFTVALYPIVQLTL